MRQSLEANNQTNTYIYTTHNTRTQRIHTSYKEAYTSFQTRIQNYTHIHTNINKAYIHVSLQALTQTTHIHMHTNDTYIHAQQGVTSGLGTDLYGSLPGKSALTMNLFVQNMSILILVDHDVIKM
jgi:hypothetical protein